MSDKENRDLKRVGLKVTTPRLKILQLLDRSQPTHLSAEDIHRQLSDLGEEIALATVYRVLAQFEAVNLVHRHYFESGQAVFELNTGGHHDHLVCVDCGHVEEFYDADIEQKQTQIALEAGYEIRDHALTIYGKCTRNHCPYRESSEL